ncbi:flagellar basal body-associated FliL family protein [Ideonella sp. B7]|uniref:flagellar basal body-associated FliL family protein n=1 Tax=Ideonella benzenivorans TaxID=2831643 RepID=UPI001CED1BC6|nr:flagellar basal body-associated FliL family protein [Ideonella benzenivorans]MCA6217976.1 flagellar basal body-associated FliL family protein [Ideonella benzenivorans]
MSAAAPAADAPPPKGKKKLIIIVLALVLLLVLGGGAAAFLLLKKQSADGEDGGDETAQVEKKPKREHKKEDPKHPPVFVPLDPFVVNLADRDSDRYAQIGVTLQVEDEKASEEIKAYLPAIRNNILLLLGHKSSEDLMAEGGKEKLAQQILRESALPLGIELEDPDEVEEAPTPGKKKRRRSYDSIDDSPIKAVQFSSFIIQ